jgi:hypothetical protein
VLRLAALGVFLLGLSRLLAEPVSWKTGRDFFTGDERAAAAALPVERCAELVRLHRRQVTCAGAAMEEAFGELVQFGLLATLLAGAALILLRRFGRPARGTAEATLEALLLTAGAVGLAAVAAASLPAGLAGMGGLEPGAGRPLLQGGLAALGAAWLALHALAAWRHLAS